LSILSGILAFTAETGALARFAGRVFAETPRRGFEWRELLRQAFLVGNRSLPLVGSTAFIMGMVLTIQLRPALLSYGVESELPYIVADAIIREIGPVITGLIFAGKVGSGIGAELGSMQVTEQIDALYMLKTDPIDYLVIPRVIACCLMLPILTTLAFATGMTGGVLIADSMYNISPRVFLDSAQNFLQEWDLISAAIKSVVFGALIAVIGSSWGLTTTGGAKGVGQSTTTAVVTALLAIFVVNFFLSWLMFQGPGSAVLRAF